MCENRQQLSILNILLVGVVFFLIGLQGCSCITDVHILVPSLVKVGGDITLNCSYTLENETLVTEKYFINEELVYSNTPAKNIPYHVYANLNVKTHVVNDDGTLTLRGVNGDASGDYRCELTTKSDILNSTEIVSDSAVVTIVEEPQEGPTITKKELGFQVGRVMEAKCTSRGGSPLANLTWFVDGEQVTYPDMSRVNEYKVMGDVNMSVSELFLPIVAEPSNSMIRLRCEASQFGLYNASTEDAWLTTVTSSGVPLFFVTGNNSWCVVFPAVFLALFRVIYC